MLRNARPQPANVFIPLADERDLPEAKTSGRHREPKVAKSREMEWPTSMAGRREMYKTWRRTAMRVLHTAKADKGLVAAVAEYFNLEQCALWPSNARLAWEVGCHERTMKRYISTYRALGLFICDYVWRVNAEGKMVKKRVIRLALPVDFELNEDIPDED